MATSVSPIGTVNKLSLNNSVVETSLPTTALIGKTLKKVNNKVFSPKVSNKSLRIVAVEQEINEKKQTEGDRWKGLGTDTSDDQHDIARGKGMVDSLFQAPTGTGTHHAIMNSYEYLSQGLRQYNLDNKMDGFYIAPSFMDKLVVHITKNFLKLPNIKAVKETFVQ